MIPHLQKGTRGLPTLVLLHGGGLSARQWQPQLDALASDFHLLAPDLPEQGRSRHLAPFTLDGAAAQVAELVWVQATDGRAHVVGLSLGGAVGLELMRSHADLVSSLFVSGTAAGLGRVLGGLSLASAELYRLLPPAWLADLSVKQFGIPAAHVETFREDLIATATPAFTRNFTRALMAMKVPSQMTAPTLIAVGERETPVARRAARTLAARLPGAHAVLAPGLGHVWNLEAPELFTQTVRAWVTGAPVPPRLRPLS